MGSQCMLKTICLGFGFVLLLHHTTSILLEDEVAGGNWPYSWWGNRTDDMEEDTWSTVQRKGNQFIVNGQPFYVNGFNTYWLMVFTVDESTRGKVSEVFQQASAVGLSVCRTWAFNDGQWRALQKSPGDYDEEVFKGLDFVRDQVYQRRSKRREGEEEVERREDMEVGEP